MRSLGMELNIRLPEYGFPCSLASPLLYPSCSQWGHMPCPLEFSPKLYENGRLISRPFSLFRHLRPQSSSDHIHDITAIAQ